MQIQGHVSTLIWLLLSLVVVVAGGCNGKSTTSDVAPEEITWGDVVADQRQEIWIVPADATSDAPETLAELTGADATEISPWECPQKGGAGCPCQINDDCGDGFCVLHQGQRVCTAACIEDCPDGWSCREMSGFGTDLVFICVSDFPALCLPCSGSSQCHDSAAKCISYASGSGSFCSGPCGPDNPCPEGYDCLEATTTEGGQANQCVQAGGTCNCSSYAVELHLGTWCTSANEFGTCNAWRECGEGGLSECDAVEPAQEICFNDVDEDCDGQYDDPDVCCHCDGKVCGDDGCGTSCGECPMNHVCTDDNQCICVPNCDGKECDDDGCGASCGECLEGTMCIFGECQEGCDTDDDCGDLDECVGGFCQPDLPDDAFLLEPLMLESVPGTPASSVFAEVFEAELTPVDGPASGLVAQAGFGPPNFDPQANPQEWQWQQADFVEDGEQGEKWTAAFVSNDPGSYAYTFRFSLDQEHWVYADSTGLADNFTPDKLGTWTVLADPEIHELVPAHGTVLGGTPVVLLGANFDPGVVVLVDGIELSLEVIDAGTIGFTAPPHARGEVDILVVNPSGQSETAKSGFAYVLEFTPTVDGTLAEWDDLFTVGLNTIESNWDPAANHLDYMMAAYDDENLYLAVSGSWEAQNYAVGYVDGDFGQVSGVADMIDLSDNAGGGDLDDALSNVLHVNAVGFGADLGFGSRGMESIELGANLDNAVFVGWRRLAPPYDLSWVPGGVACSENAVETVIPLATVFPAGVPPEGTEVAVVVKLIDQFGDADGISNQTVPGFFDPEHIKAVGEVASFRLLP